VLGRIDDDERFRLDPKMGFWEGLLMMD